MSDSPFAFIFCATVTSPKFSRFWRYSSKPWSRRRSGTWYVDETLWTPTTCLGVTWQNIDTFSMVAVRRGCSHRQAILEIISFSSHQELRVAHQVGQKTETSQIPHTSLSRLCLLLASDHGYERHVDQREVVVSDSELKLAHRFDERS